jgi:hypothetical protein
VLRNIFLCILYLARKNLFEALIEDRLLIGANWRFQIVLVLFGVVNWRFSAAFLQALIEICLCLCR